MNIISDEQVRSAISMGEAISVMRDAYTQLGRGDAGILERGRVNHPAGALSAMGAVLAGAGVYATHAGQFDFIIPLFSIHDGRLLGVVQGNAITALRTAAVTRIAADLLAPDGASTLALFGTGIQAKAHLAALMPHSGIRQILVVGRGEIDHDLLAIRAAFPGIEVDEVSSAHAAEHADILVTATRSTTPLFDGARLKPGCFVAAIGSSKPDSREIDDATLARARSILVEWRPQARLEAGDLLMAANGLVDWAEVLELGELLAGQVSLPEAGDGVRVYKSIGIGLADVALAEFAFRKLS